MRYRIAASPTETCQHYFALKPREGERREVERKIAVSAQEVFLPTWSGRMGAGEARLRGAVCTELSVVPIVPQMRYVSAGTGRLGDEA